ncbi:uncharacterized protein TRUGW13939_01249 [Talaromyces rugulosus]|uniref:Myb-like domain-containing protein n=1 Tax=Talaromyces rugulosus TaxID=121627 RepID=A0A7H8QKY9_TALRU|nr:uncharacterized protein TRUGW13939_01249 [Talaromyces rugulosus]QKX54165.1 hypothetical protein TRUGW13939_01249 [Talaromyces rugulosus]
MEPPNKRRRLSPSHQPRNDFQDDTELQIARARNDKKLKSLFEGIFEKYGKDFSDVGDEIDLRTGEIVVNKGHVSLMEHEDDTGEVLETSQKKDSPRKASNAHESHEPDLADDSDDELAPDGKRVLQSLIAGDMDNDIESFDMEKGKNGTVTPRGNRPRSDPEDEIGGDKIELAGLEYPQAYNNTAKATDPIWQVPEIAAKFWTPPKMQTPPKKELNIPDTRPSSPPTAGSIWAVRTPGRPRGASSKKPTSTKKSTPSLPSKRRRKKPVVLDWTFANMKSDDSDSDDPLQEEAPSSTTQSIKIRGRSSVSITPTPIKTVARNVIGAKSNNTTRKKPVSKIEYGRLREVVSLPRTPEVASSPQRLGTTPVHTSDKEMSSPTKMRPVEFILTPDEVKLIVQMKSKSMEYTWDDIVEHLPGRTVDDLQDWEESHPDLLDKTPTTSGGWSREDLSKLDQFVSQSGIWWKDIQAALPTRSRGELESQMIKMWMEKELLREDSTDQPESNEQDQSSPGISADTPTPPKTQQSHPLYSDDDPALRTGTAMTNQDPEDPLEEDSEDDWPEISAIEVESRPAEKSGGSRRGSPRKGSASPRKFF